MRSFKLEGRILAQGLRFPEGPIALSDGGVLVVEIEGGRLMQVQADGRLQAVAQLGGGPNGAALGPDGHCYVCNNGGFSWRTDERFTRPTGPSADYEGGAIQRVNLRSGTVETLYTHCDGVPLHGPNDIVFDANGGVWFTDFGQKFSDRLMHRALRPARSAGTRAA